MRVFRGQINEVVVMLIVTVLVATGLLILLAVGRRWRRNKHLRRLDRLQETYGPVIAHLVGGELGYEQAFSILNAISTPDRLAVLELLCLEKKPSAAALPLIRELCEDLGMVGIWQQRLSQGTETVPWRALRARLQSLVLRLTHLRFLVRASSAENLRAIHHQPSWPLLAEALHDPQVDVQEVAERALAEIAEPQSFLPLVERLHVAVLDPAAGICPRSVKAALSSFSLEQAQQLIPSLRHRNPEIRSLATDIIRHMVRLRSQNAPGLMLAPGDLGMELSEIFLTTLRRDENPNVRAHAAFVIALLQDSRAPGALLTLIQDPQWLVRLHAVRALAHRPCPFQLTEIARCLVDPQWTVRQTAAKTLCGFGATGLSVVIEHSLGTKDMYSREQIADELQRAGLIPVILERYERGADGQEARLLEQFVQMGKTSYLMEVLSNGCSERLRQKFVQDFAHLGSREFRAKLRTIASSIPAGRSTSDGFTQNRQAA